MVGAAEGRFFFSYIFKRGEEGYIDKWVLGMERKEKGSRILPFGYITCPECLLFHNSDGLVTIPIAH